MEKRAWPPTNLNYGDSEIREIEISRYLEVKPEIAVYLYTKPMDQVGYSGQVVEVAFMNTKSSKIVLNLQFETLANLTNVTPEGILIDPDLLEGRGPVDVFNTTVAMYMASRGKLSVDGDFLSNEISITFQTRHYHETLHMTAKQAKKVFEKVI